MAADGTNLKTKPENTKPVHYSLDPNHRRVNGSIPPRPTRGLSHIILVTNKIESTFLAFDNYGARLASHCPNCTPCMSLAYVYNPPPTARLWNTAV